MSEQLPPTEQCRSCKAPIRWARTQHGKHIPINAEPSASGNVLLDHIGGVLHAGVMRGNQLAAIRRTDRPLFLPHFVDCPNAGEWRKR
ncbi:hypothetical protein [Rhodococcus sp. JVH1]|uniref:hypothetical protein n=1 Tax=Rhodococcus sp. JVH1 TaxID=745408 RepID=UPI00027207EC|nr:hypothetical protein [Rhodococcus sp. JVH1]EJJ01017.1 hypothetical protein JVH1_1643 [Rhodococcus sp. JVH1]